MVLVTRISAAATVALASAAAAATPPSASRIAYDAAYYARFSPSTALDMIKETPGFAFEDTGQIFRSDANATVADGERDVVACLYGLMTRSV